MPHQLALTDPVVYQVDVILRRRSADGRREQRIADFLKRRIELVIQQSTDKSPYYKTIEFVRAFLTQQLNSIFRDKIDILALRVKFRGKAGVGGNNIGADIRVP